MWARERGRLAAVARGVRAADLYVRGGLLLNVYTGERYPANVAASGERIAYVGLRDDMVGPRTRVLDASGRTLVPGYVEPHAHPCAIVTPTALARHVLPLGTTAIVGDNLPVYMLGGQRGFETAVAALSRGPLRFYWMIRPHAQSPGGDMGRFQVAAIRRMLAHPLAVAIGEVTRWPDVWSGRADMLARLEPAARLGKRIEGHTAGAGPERLSAIAAAGVTSDHEPITADEALFRARQGLAVMLRQSSLRPDLSPLLRGLVKTGLPARLMLTTDGSTPAWTAEHGFVDGLVRVALDEGVSPAEAYRMVTLAPAAYYGRDGDLGGIAPGRFADLSLLRDPGEPRPEVVVSRGRVAAREGRLLARVPEPPWRRIFASPSAKLALRAPLSPDELRLPRGRQPVIRLESAVITRLEERPPAPGDLHAALVERQGRWLTTAAVAGFATELDGLATTLSTDYHVLALGRSREAMVAALDRVVALGGGIALVEGGRVVFELPLPVGGIMSPRPLPEVAQQERTLGSLLRARGHAHHAPLYTLLFLTADFLPAARLTARGVWDVKTGRVFRPSRRR
jgi:adenine deaminase